MPPLVAEAAPITYYYTASDGLFEVALHEPDAGLRSVPEALVQDLWQYRRFDPNGLATTSGKPVTICHPGVLNHDGGPDFRNAHIRIGATDWHGDIEVHVTSRGWFDHKHQHNPRYDSVVLHVVLYPDLWTGGLLRSDGSVLPEVVLHERLERPLRSLLHAFHTSPDKGLLCASRWREVPQAVRDPYVETLGQARLRDRVDTLADAYRYTPSLDDLLHERLFAVLGYAKNADAMATLARRLPCALVRRLTDPLDIEAFHLGTAGLLPSPADLLGADRATADYAMALRDRYDRLQYRFPTPPMRPAQWRFFRLRPANMPPLRIAQAAALMAPGGLLRTDPLALLEDALAAPDALRALTELLAVRPGPFWETHLRLDRATKPRSPGVGRTRIRRLLVNAVLPLLLLLARQQARPSLEKAALRLYRRLPPEDDEVTRRFKALGTRPDDALDAQGLHQLYRTRCTQARCLDCNIGRHLLGQ